MVFLITGKAGAGKTHYGKALAKELKEQGVKVKVIDGDDFRKDCDNEDYTDQGRTKNLYGAAALASGYEGRGYTVIMSFIAPRRVWRDVMRKCWKKSRVIYIPGGVLWKDTTYENPTDVELEIREN